MQQSRISKPPPGNPAPAVDQFAEEDEEVKQIISSIKQQKAGAGAGAGAAAGSDGGENAENFSDLDFEGVHDDDGADYREHDDDDGFEDSEFSDDSEEEEVDADVKDAGKWHQTDQDAEEGEDSGEEEDNLYAFGTPPTRGSSKNLSRNKSGKRRAMSWD